MQYRQVTFVVDDEGTVSDAQKMGAYELRGLSVPTIDSATIGFQVSLDGTTFRVVNVNTGTSGALTLGTADTGAKFVAIPNEVARATPGTQVKLVFSAAQNGGPYSIVGHLVKEGPG